MTSTPRRQNSASSPSANAPFEVVLVVAAARNRIIGRDGGMPWRMPSDLKTFRRLTVGHPIIMGRRTFQSIGRALDKRTNIVITRDPSFSAQDVLTVSTFEAALKVAAAHIVDVSRQVMVIGGGQVYQEALPHANRIYFTEINAEPTGDTEFPALDVEIWQEVDRSPIPADPRDDYCAELITYERKS